MDFSHPFTHLPEQGTGCLKTVAMGLHFQRDCVQTPCSVLCRWTKMAHTADGHSAERLLPQSSAFCGAQRALVTSLSVLRSQTYLRSQRYIDIFHRKWLKAVSLRSQEQLCCHLWMWRHTRGDSSVVFEMSFSRNPSVSVWENCALMMPMRCQ